MKTFILRLVTLVLPALVASSCSGTTSSPADMKIVFPDLNGVDLARASRDLATADLYGTIPDLYGADLSGTTPDMLCMGSPVYRLVSGSYPVVFGSGVIVADTCMTGVTSSDVQTTRQIVNDGSINISLKNADGSVLIGSGPIRCNVGTLINGPISLSDGRCRYTANYRTELTVTADNTFQMDVAQTRSGIVAEAGQVCNQPSPCTVEYKTLQKM